MARLFELTTPLGENALLFRSLRGREELARLSEFDVEAVSTRPEIQPGELLGKNVTVKIELRNGGRRYLDGYVTRFAHGGMVGRHYLYRMRVNPWLWFLTRSADCRIFQGKTVPDIVEEVFGEYPAAVFKFQLHGTFAPREYCVQYRESDLAFVSRLIEEEGIYYYFDHTDGRHVMKLVNSYAGHAALPGKATIAFFAPGIQVRVEEEFIHDWTAAQGIQPGILATDDYDSTKPKVDLAAKASTIQKHDYASHEWYDWPGGYQELPVGKQLVRVRTDEVHAEFERAEARGNVREVAVGGLFTLTNTTRRDQQREYLIVSVDYDLRDNAYESSPEDAATFRCAFTVMPEPAKQPFRPARLTPRPTVKGLHSAVVTGPAGEEIYCDKYGRVKVQFHWDRYGRNNENSSCWIRVAHPWAGSKWGMVALPRMGQEVIVDFLEGDPDQPIIVGRVYNDDQMPPYPLPANKTQTGTKTRSSKGGGPANFNEIRLEDLKGSEQLYIHAEKNQDIEVENDETHWVGHDRTETVGNDEKITVGGNRTESVAKDETIGIGKNRTESVADDETVSIGKNQTLSVGSNRSVSVEKDESVNVSGNRNDHVTNNEDRIVGKHRQVSIGQNDTLQVGKTLAVTAEDQITIQSGSASIILKRDGTISIKGKDITIEGSGKINVKASRDVVIKGSKVIQN